MLVQILIGEKDVTVREDRRVTAGAASLLHIIFQRIRYFVVDYQSYILLIDAHTEGGGGDDDPGFTADKRVLVCDLFAPFHLAVVRQGIKPVRGQSFGDLKSLLYSRDINDRGAVLGLQQPSRGHVFFIFIFHEKHGIMQVLAGGGGGEKLQVQAELVLEIVADIADDLLLRGGRKA